jgi:hypothetical protein
LQCFRRRFINEGSDHHSPAPDDCTDMDDSTSTFPRVSHDTGIGSTNIFSTADMEEPPTYEPDSPNYNKRATKVVRVLDGVCKQQQFSTPLKEVILPSPNLSPVSLTEIPLFNLTSPIAVALFHLQ